MSRSILIVDDEATLAKNIMVYLARHDYDARSVGSGEAALDELETFRPDVMLLDLSLPGIDGMQVLAQVREQHVGMRVVVFTGHGSTQAAVDAMKAGAADYLSKPIGLAELKLLLDRLAGQERIESALAYYQQREARQSGLDRVLGDSMAVRRMRDEVKRFVDAEHGLTDDQPPAVLVTGETGTGKELVARAFHFDGPRAEFPFIEINCASIPADLLEAELFGFERGAFTGASNRKTGLIESAEGGTLFLDEIGELDPKMQAKLLKVLEDRRIRRIGSVQERDVNVRIIAATNQQLERRVAEGAFRSDLYFRLRVLHVELPPLRVRDADVALLAQHFLDLHASRYGKTGLEYSEGARLALSRYNWPGNVRELRNVVERAVLIADGRHIGAEQLAISSNSGVPVPVHNSHGDPADDTARGDDDTVDSDALDPGDFNLEALELRTIRGALTLANGNISRAARLLGLSRDTLRYRIKKLGLRDPGTPQHNLCDS